MGDPGQAVERLKALRKTGFARSGGRDHASPRPSLQSGRAKGRACDRKSLDLGAGGT
ncbi:hypothetical protein HMPREF0185_00373 [Brevundimonas diminuta 470-4]|nr:hypothetical protein HMPREF0185_00373 [Brevundimonas diminuta 470-4]